MSSATLGPEQPQLFKSRPIASLETLTKVLEEVVLHHSGHQQAESQMEEAAEVELSREVEEAEGPPRSEGVEEVVSLPVLEPLGPVLDRGPEQSLDQRSAEPERCSTGTWQHSCCILRMPHKGPARRNTGRTGPRSP